MRNCLKNGMGHVEQSILKRLNFCILLGTKKDVIMASFFSLLNRFQFPEIKPDSFFKLLGGERLIVGERAEEFVSSGDYNDQDN